MAMNGSTRKTNSHTAAGATSAAVTVPRFAFSANAMGRSLTIDALPPLATPARGWGFVRRT